MKNLKTIITTFLFILIASGAQGAGICSLQETSKAEGIIFGKNEFRDRSPVEFEASNAGVCASVASSRMGQTKLFRTLLREDTRVINHTAYRFSDGHVFMSGTIELK